MKALVYHGPGKKAWEEKPKPGIKVPTDAIVKILKTTICGTDLHIMKGDVPEVTDGRIIGHEGVGIVEEVGSAVSNFKKGDHVLISCITSCGKCEYCKKGMYSHCVDGGWILGNLIDGTQAEYVRIPYADNSLYPIPSGADEEALVMLSDILPTGFECGVLKRPGKAGGHHCDRRRGACRACRLADRSVLYSGGDHHDRLGRQSSERSEDLRGDNSS